MINEIVKQLKPLINGKLIYLSQYGSHLYGLNTENSDLDFRGVYIPTLDDIILKKDKDEINTEIKLWEIRDFNKENPTYHVEEPTVLINSWYLRKVKVDVKIFSLQKFIQLCSKADTNALDLLFSVEDNFIEKYIEYNRNVTDSVIWQLYSNRSKLINTDRLESPITYAFKQATKYGLKGKRLFYLQYVLKEANKLSLRPIAKPHLYHTVCELVNDHLSLDGEYLKTDELDNKGKKELYFNVCGVQHQYNLELDEFINRIEEKIKKEYTSQRTIDASDGNDWKALSHAIRVLLEIKELLDTGSIQFPLKDKDFLLDIKLGKVERKDIDEFFNKELSEILERVQKNELKWKYDEEFWNNFILNEVK